MPAAPSSLTDPAIGQLLTGARSFTAIAEWAADADQATLDAFGVTGVVPCESTFRRTLQHLDADALDDAAGAWVQQRTVPAPGARPMIAVDGKTQRGSGLAGGPGRHLLAALDHAHGAVLGQVDVEAKTNEIPMFATLLDHVGVAGAVVTADAMHARRGHAEYLVTQRGAHYLLTVKGNQPGLHAQLAELPWRQVPVAHSARERGHGRAERRTVKVTAVAAGLAFPYAAQALRIVRRRRPLIRRRPLPGPHRQRSSRDGQLAQPGNRHPAADRANQHRRRPAPPRPPAWPTAAHDHELLTDNFAGALSPDS